MSNNENNNPTKKEVKDFFETLNEENEEKIINDIKN